MSTDLAVRNGAEIMERVLLAGDLEKLEPKERLRYYLEVCESLGLNHLTQPFQYIKLNGKLTLYATRTAADQLRRRDGVSIDAPHIEVINDTYVVTVTARDKGGRTDSEIGAVPIKGLQGEALANAMMKALTKAKRRVTLSIVGLGWLDETEVQSIPDAQPVVVDMTTGVIGATAPPVPHDGRVIEAAAVAASDDEPFVDADDPLPTPTERLALAIAQARLVLVKSDYKAINESAQIMGLPAKATDCTTDEQRAAWAGLLEDAIVTRGDVVGAA